jgi:hypothetical protein
MSGHVIQNLRHQLPPRIQFKLDLWSAGGRPTVALRPLGDLNSARRDLNLEQGEILFLLSQRRLIGFNIAVKTEGRAELRILTRSLEHFRETGGQANPEREWPQILRLIFPTLAGPLRPELVTGLELQRSLNCSRAHVENLAARHFEILRPARKGRGHTPGFRAGSVERWLQSRMF